MSSANNNSDNNKNSSKMVQKFQSPVRVYKYPFELVMKVCILFAVGVVDLPPTPRNLCLCVCECMGVHALNACQP